MLLDGELARVYIESKLPKGHSPSWKLFPGPTNGEHEELSHNVSDTERRLEEAVIRYWLALGVAM
jgi:hypothetical protein